MSLLVRWVKFNAVGVLGMGVQLAALAGFNRWFAGHYLAATCAALELTLLHNFWWHQRFTWRDRMVSTPRLQALVRFHLSNGLVSLCGNLLLMRVLVHGAACKCHRDPLLLGSELSAQHALGFRLRSWTMAWLWRCRGVRMSERARACGWNCATTGRSPGRSPTRASTT